MDSHTRAAFVGDGLWLWGASLSKIPSLVPSFIEWEGQYPSGRGVLRVKYGKQLRVANPTEETTRKIPVTYKEGVQLKSGNSHRPISHRPAFIDAEQELWMPESREQEWAGYM